MFRLILVGLLSSFISTQVEARTIRYEFDIVSSDIYYRYLEKQTESFDYISPSAAESAAFISQSHSVGSALGQTGAITLEVIVRQSSPSSIPFVGELNCVSGFLCSTVALASSSHNSPVNVFSVASGFSIGPGNPPHEWTLVAGSSGSGTLDFYDDGDFRGSEVMGGALYWYSQPHGAFTLANLTIIEIAPVPLPATAWLLGLGILAVGFKTRRRARAA